ncbi:hypothetical protein JW868_02010 [Candidatus Woesearchaeota archaeon]|nr:hypothetical protein [Candidatus Woesearchaeota archaeon]
MIEIYYYDGSLKKGSIDNTSKLRKYPIWIDITDITKEEADTIKKVFNLHPLTVEDLVNNHTRIKVEDFPQYVFCVFYRIKKEKKIEIKELDFVL